MFGSVNRHLASVLSTRRHARWRLALALIFLIGSTGTLGHMLIARLPFVDAVYQTVITVTTVGFKDIALENVTETGDAGRLVWVKLFDTFLIVVGIGVIGYSLSVFMHSLIEGELREAIGLRRLKRKVRFMKNHYIVCGYGRMGAIIAETLMGDDISVVVVENDPALRDQIIDRDLICLTGDATHDELLREAAIEKAAGLIAVTNSDPENLFITLSARQMNPELMIVTRALSPEAEKKLLRAGANRVILPYKIGAHQIAQAALRPNVVDFIDIATRTSTYDIEMEEVQVGPTSELLGKKLREASVIRELGLIVIGMRWASDDQMHFNPPAESVLNAGDTLIILGPRKGLAAAHKYLT